ncbi:hypothetical protein, partial [Heyndrickxia sporothermodurans]
SVPIYWNSFTYYENKVRVRVEKYFFDTLPTGQTVDVSTFIEGGSVSAVSVVVIQVPYSPASKEGGFIINRPLKTK